MGLYSNDLEDFPVIRVTTKVKQSQVGSKHEYVDYSICMLRMGLRNVYVICTSIPLASALAILVQFRNARTSVPT
jgi:hypothetical protein